MENFPNAGPGCDLGRYRTGEVPQVGDVVKNHTEAVGALPEWFMGDFGGTVLRIDGQRVFTGTRGWDSGPFAARFDLVSRPEQEKPEVQPAPPPACVCGHTLPHPNGRRCCADCDDQGLGPVKPLVARPEQEKPEAKGNDVCSRCHFSESMHQPPAMRCPSEGGGRYSPPVQFNEEGEEVEPERCTNCGREGYDHTCQGGCVHCTVDATPPQPAPAAPATSGAVITEPGLYRTWAFDLDACDEGYLAEVVGKGPDGRWYGRGPEGPDSWGDDGVSHRWPNSGGNLSGPYTQPPEPEAFEGEHMLRNFVVRLNSTADGPIHVWPRTQLADAIVAAFDLAVAQVNAEAGAAGE